MFHEHHFRSVLKSFTWLVVGFSVTFTILVLIARDWKVALLEALLIQAIKFVFFYLHERLWNRTNFGQQIKIKK